jgi:hypothetical protein
MMRLRLPLITIAFVVALSAADVSGVWNMTLRADWTTIPALVCSFSQSGQNLTGSCRAIGDTSGDDKTH